MLKAFESVLVFERIHFECVSSGIWVFVSMKVYECFQLDIFVTFVVCHSVRSKGVYYNDSGSRLHRDNLNKCEHKYAPNIKGNVNCPLTYCASVSVSYALEIVEILLDLSVECHIISIIWLDFRCADQMHFIRALVKKTTAIQAKETVKYTANIYFYQVAVWRNVIHLIDKMLQLFSIHRWSHHPWYTHTRRQNTTTTSQNDWMINHSLWMIGFPMCANSQLLQRIEMRLEWLWLFY